MRQFTTQAQEHCYDVVADVMQQLYGESALAVEEAPVFRLGRGTVGVNVYVVPWGDARAVIDVTSWVVLQARPTLELYKFLLERNMEQRFGAFALDSVGDIQFSYRLAASVADKEALHAAIEGVFWTASQFDREIVARFGGLRPHDAAAQRDFEQALDAAGLRPEDRRAG